MAIAKFEVGRLSSNTYIYYIENTAFLFDIGGEDIEAVIEFLEKNNLNLEKIILTHGHIDHIEGLNALTEKYPNTRIYIGEEDYEFLYDAVLNLSAYFDDGEFQYKGKPEITKIKQGDMIGDFQVIDTPGHTRGSKCFYNKEENFMITGDTLFQQSIGRSDLPTGDYNEIKASVNKILAYNKDIKVMPGHGLETSLEKEKNVLKFY